MPVIEQTIAIQRPLFDVFKAATDFENFPEWQAGTTAVRLTSAEPVRSGTMVSILRGGTLVNADVLDYQRHKSLTLKGIWGRFRFSRTQEFSSLGGGSTQIKDSFTIQLGFLWFWYSPFLQASLTRQFKSDWARLKQQLEKS